jgi:spermidine synthase
VPSFGEWGFILAYAGEFAAEPRFPPGLRYLRQQTYEELFQFPPDMDRIETEVNRLNNQALVRYFEQEWAHAVH